MEKRGLPIPEHLFPIELLPGAGDILQAFDALSSDRNNGFGLGMIPFTAISEYARRINLEDDDFWFFHDVIHQMDIAFLNKQKDAP